MSQLSSPPSLDISQQIEMMWLDSEFWADVNDYVGDTRQLWGVGQKDSPMRQHMLQIAKQCDEECSDSDYSRVLLDFCCTQVEAVAGDADGSISSKPAASKSKKSDSKQKMAAKKPAKKKIAKKPPAKNNHGKGRLAHSI